MIYDIYNALIKSDLIIQKECQIDFFEFPDTDKVDKVNIIIQPVTSPKPTDYADGTYTALEQIFQIDVLSKDYDDTSTVAQEVTDVLFHVLRFPQSDSMGPEYDSDTDLHRDARRYRCKKSTI